MNTFHNIPFPDLEIEAFACCFGTSDQDEKVHFIDSEKTICRQMTAISRESGISADEQMLKTDQIFKRSIRNWFSCRCRFGFAGLPPKARLPEAEMPESTKWPGITLFEGV